MILNRLVITGFKSFVKKTTFEFKDPFTAIVGPNGGGKTNVVDALRWVMGEQSLKMIRCKKAEDVIFSGSEKSARAGLAQIDLHLDNSSGRLPIDYSEVVLSRRLHRQGESEYLINKQLVRWQDIILLLAKANFGQKSYGIIGQGMITEILQANPQDRKEYFDEATGVKEFQIKRDQAINKLIRTEDNLSQAEALLAEIEPRLRSLARQVSRLEKRQKLEDELNKLRVNYYGSLWQQLNEQIKIRRQQKEEGQEQAKSLQQNSQQIENELQKLQAAESRENSYRQLQTEQLHILTEKNKLIREQIVLKGELEIQQRQQGELNLIWLEKRQEEIRATLEKSWLEIKREEREIAFLEGTLGRKKEDDKYAQQNFKDLEYKLLKEKENLEKEKEILSVPEIKEELKNLFNQQELFLKKLIATESLDQFKEVQSEAKKITKTLAELLDRLHSEKKEEIAAKQTLIEQIRIKLQAALSTKEKTLTEINELRLKIQIKRERINIILEKNKKEQGEKESLEKTIQQAKAKWQEKLAQTEKIKIWQKKNKVLAAAIEQLDQRLADSQKKIDNFNQQEEAKRNTLFKLQNDLKREQLKLGQWREETNQTEIELAKLETRLADLKDEMARELNETIRQLCQQERAGRYHGAETRLEIERLKSQLDLIGGIDPETIKEYREVKERRDWLKKQTTDLNKSLNSLDQLIDQLDEVIKKQFEKSFREISKNFEKYFKFIFAGGHAKLSLVTEKEIPDPTELKALENSEPEASHQLGKSKKKQKIVSGIEIEACPPGKKVRNVQALSGGEKSMAAIALICAIIDVNSPPFVILDEVEAALDEINSEKFAGIIRKLSRKTQFIVITHNRVTMHQADILYGVTMNTNGASDILSVKLPEAEKMAAQRLTKTAV